MTTDYSSLFIGADTPLGRRDGSAIRRIYLDSAASTLQFRPALQAIGEVLSCFGNTHSQAHTGARTANRYFAWAHEQVLSYLGLAGDEHEVVFAGSGCTHVINRLARKLGALRPERDVVLVSGMEHHSNDLPHRQHAGAVEHIWLEKGGSGLLSLEHARRLIQQYGQRINYVAVAAVSNVTGLANPVNELAHLAHSVGAFILVDGAQAVAHVAIDMQGSRPGEHLDMLVFSGHKLYSPLAPGVAVVSKTLSQQWAPVEFGGGMVSDVGRTRFTLHPDRAQHDYAGTPPIAGAIALGFTLYGLQKLGLAHVHSHSAVLSRYLQERLQALNFVRIYGTGATCDTPRVGAVSFNIDAMPHEALASILDEQFGISVRSGCFCAHGYVRELLLPDFMSLDDDDEAELQRHVNENRGMVRASVGLHTTTSDVDALISALETIHASAVHYLQVFRRQSAQPGTAFDASRIHPLALIDEELALTRLVQPLPMEKLACA